jgi:two-component system nitrogen regulation response regulator NtrX
MSKAILIVDDEESICQTLGGILTDEGHEVFTASSGEEALRLVEEDPPNLILLDIWLPGIDVRPWNNRNGGEVNETRRL